MMKLTTQPAEQLLKKFKDAYKNRDIKSMMDLFTEKSNMWGTGIDEYRVGLKQIAAQLQRDWSQSEKAEMEIVSLVATPEDALWAAAVCRAKVTVDGKEHIFEDLRGTITVENVNGSWKILHMHASFPDYRNAENSSFPIDNL